MKLLPLDFATFQGVPIILIPPPQLPLGEVRSIIDKYHDQYVVLCLLRNSDGKPVVAAGKLDWAYDRKTHVSVVFQELFDQSSATKIAGPFINFRSRVYGESAAFVKHILRNPHNYECLDVVQSTNKEICIGPDKKDYTFVSINRIPNSLLDCRIN